MLEYSHSIYKWDWRGEEKAGVIPPLPHIVNHAVAVPWQMCMPNLRGGLFENSVNKIIIN
jgi:hypothetical protein